MVLTGSTSGIITNMNVSEKLNDLNHNYFSRLLVICSCLIIFIDFSLYPMIVAVFIKLSKLVCSTFVINTVFGYNINYGSRRR